MNDRVMNIGILAHVDAGKTTLTEQILYKSGAIMMPGRVDSGNTVTDSMAVEKTRGITVRATTTSFTHRGMKINLIDTPGHMDFIAEVERVFAVLDGAVLVLSAREMVQSQTRIIFGLLHRFRIPTILFINKIDRLGVDLTAVYTQIQELLTKDYVVMQQVSACHDGYLINPSISPEGLERICLEDETLLNAYVAGNMPSYDALLPILACETHLCHLYPIYHGAALRGHGIEALMDAIAALLPRPSFQPEGPSGAYIYKIDRDDKGRHRAFGKVISGSLRIRQDIPIATQENRMIKIRSLLTPSNGLLAPTDLVCCGDIAIIENAQELRCGDILGCVSNPLPVAATEKAPMEVSVTPEPPETRRALIDALTQLTQEDPQLSVAIQERTQEISIHVLGQTQREIVESLLDHRYGLRPTFGKMLTIYKETPLKPADATIAFGMPNPYEAAMSITVTPLPRGSGVQFCSEVSFGYLTASFQAAAEAGLRSACSEGPCHWEVTDLMITLTWAQFSSVTSTPADFRSLASFLLDRALRASGTLLLEPCCHFSLEIPANGSGKGIYDIEQMRGTTASIETRGDVAVIRGLVPAQTSREYNKEVLSATGGKGLFTLSPAGYAPYPGEAVMGKENRSLEWKRLQAKLIAQEG